MRFDTMNRRTIAGIASGFLILWVIFYFFAVIMVMAWPGMREVVIQVRDNNDYSGLTPAMLVAYIVVWSLSYLGTGWVTVKITGRGIHALVAITPFFLFAAYNHFYAMWELFPPVYNLAVVLPVYPLAWLGGKMAGSE